ncbi:MAG: apolipoprotein N-acyltransferase, partial [Candidatus Omnitrophica bacterium]|nr:apolipoprotein N-acyltransferase [Candidatus Omnitrophota bacterium]
NSAVLFSDRGYIVQYYDKLHLVPFGEYIPLRKYLRFLETIVPIGDFAAGKEYKIFEVKNEKLKTKSYFAVLICFEDIFPELSRQFAKQGVDFLVNITNDAWFGKTAAAYQHLQSSIFRAVENRLPLIRSANTGISGFISSRGKILSLVKDASGKNIYISGFATQEITLPGKRNLSFYTRFGDLFVLWCLFIVLMTLTFKIKMRS